MKKTEFAELLDRHRPRLVRFFRRRAAALRRQESPEDLAQGVHLYALQHGDAFEFRGEPAAVAWLLRLARQHLARRVGHWKAMKRDGGPMLRITLAEHPTTGRPGPLTAAEQSEQLLLASRAMDGLPERDRELVRLMNQDLPVREIAGRLGLSEAAAQRARLRAMERFRKIFVILSQAHDAGA